MAAPPTPPRLSAGGTVAPSATPCLAPLSGSATSAGSSSNSAGVGGGLASSSPPVAFVLPAAGTAALAEAEAAAEAVAAAVDATSGGRSAPEPGRYPVLAINHTSTNPIARLTLTHATQDLLHFDDCRDRVPPLPTSKAPGRFLGTLKIAGCPTDGRPSPACLHSAGANPATRNLSKCASMPCDSELSSRNWRDSTDSALTWRLVCCCSRIPGWAEPQGVPAPVSEVMLLPQPPRRSREKARMT